MIWLLTVLVPLSIHAKDFGAFYKTLASQTREQKILKALEFFRETPAGLDPLGEGKGLDPDPTFSLSKFDCTTYVETMLAIGFAKNQSDIPNQLNQVRYQGDAIDFFQRNHFIVSDWIPSNTKKSFITEITASLTPEKSAYKTDSRTLKKTFWFFHRVVDLMEKQNKTPKEVLSELSKVPLVPPREDKATFISADYFRENADQLQQNLPDVSIVMIVRRNTNVPTLVTHTGFVIKKNGRLYFNHAPQAKPWKVQEQLLEDYFKDMDAHRAPVEGLLFLKINDR